MPRGVIAVSENLKEEISANVDGLQKDLEEIVRRLHAQPETGLQEHKTAAYLAGVLAGAGFSVESGIAGLDTAFRATWGTGPVTVALLAEMDALPGLGHACGHNVIAAAAVGGAIALSRSLRPEQMRVVVFGTPAEELGIGKLELIRHGYFDDIDAAMMVHPSSRRQVIKEYLGLAKIRFTFRGKPAHAAAYPEEGINALDGVIQTFNAINALRQQLRDDVRVHGIITEGGAAANIIPARAACYFYVRAVDLDELDRVKARVIACARGAALATGTEVSVEEDERVMAPLRINEHFYKVYSDQLAWLGLPEANGRRDLHRGSSDIGNVSQVVPTIHPHVPLGPGLHIHTEAFAAATVSAAGFDAAAEGAKALALTAAALALDTAVLAEIRAQFNQ